MNSVDQFGIMIPGGDSKPHWFIAFAIVCAIMMHAPYLIQYKVIPCFTDAEHDQVMLDCWKVKQRYYKPQSNQLLIFIVLLIFSNITTTTLWEFYGYVFQFIVKIIPTLIISILNIIMLIKMKVS